MTIQQFFGNTHFIAYVRLLRQLHQLIRNRADETPEGDALRERMDEPADYLTDAEIDCLNAISADFYTLASPSRPVQPNPPPSARDDLIQSFEAKETRDFPRALELLRRNEAFRPPAGVAYFRGRIWSEAGEDEIAVEFFQKAKDLEPQRGGYGYMWLEALSRVDEVVALAHARQFLQQPADHPPQLILKAADLVFASVTQQPDEGTANVLQKLVRVFEDVVLRLEMSAEPGGENIIADTLCLVSRCYERLGHVDEARRWLDKGLATFPKHAPLLIVRGVHLFETDPDGSARDFNRAIQVDSNEALPYFFLAYYYHMRDRSEECVKMASAATRLSNSPFVRANCLEWIAISEEKLGYPPEGVRATFLAAKQLAPDNPQIGRNLKFFEESLTTVPVSPPPSDRPSRIRWERPSADAFLSSARQHQLLLHLE
jgi:tetratricopeptide (TPR) repeat protein